ncbi:ribonuclease G [Desulfolithobacter dissulfuricans]|uniref:Ribonuclease G n=1 Tax=Desulfolithobacter dissulfuricans TaxID=2795293 RepID=A0A915XL37_9BACT|nr:Rne/Rng family ribonuclease [Desulfolithobacter dissulfuricans]BCO09116.1 ribonuclease G [Desulfolithobacter dissulfuricans]
MYTDILINATPYENRIALVEAGNLLEFHLERPAEKGLTGNIYKGRVVRVLPGMQAAFVDIGLERTGFLYVDDIHIAATDDIENRMTNGDQPCTQYTLDSPEQDSPGQSTGAPSIDELLKEGQEVLVQISKEPIGTKGARLTCHITLPCRNLVFMPLTDHIGISRKITDEEVRQRLRETIEKLRPQGTGFIVRTVAENVSDEELEADMEFLLVLWDEIKSAAAKAPVPSLVYKDLDMVLRSVRDLFTKDINELIVDSRPVYERLLSFVQTFAPELQSRIIHYDGATPLFESYGIEVDINRALDKKVWLRSGGYIIIETTEALTVIDVNTGRYVGKNDLAETIFKTNMEAVKEIAYQLRLRNIGGIIIIDFIDMDSEQHREELFTAFQEAMRKDKNRVNILRLSEFGLVQMTRKRSCESLSQLMSEPCFYCGGDGIIKSRRSICYEIFRKISRDAKKIGGRNVTIKVHPRVADMLLREESSNIELLEQETGKRFTIIPVRDIHIKRYEVIWKE